MSFRGFLVYTSHLSVGVLGVQMFTTAPGSLWVLGFSTQALILVQRAFYPPTHLTSKRHIMFCFQYEVRVQFIRVREDTQGIAGSWLVPARLKTLRLSPATSYVTEAIIRRGGRLKYQIIDYTWPILVLIQWGIWKKGFARLGITKDPADGEQGFLLGGDFKTPVLGCQHTSSFCLFSALVTLSAEWLIKNCFVLTSLLIFFYYNEGLTSQTSIRSII